MSFPLLFTLNGHSRHEILLVSPSTNLKSFNKAIVSAAADSPNTSEFMGKYKKKDEASREHVTELKVHWNMSGRDAKIFPTSTLITDKNVEAVLKMIEAGGVGKDVLEVTMEAEQ